MPVKTRLAAVVSDPGLGTRVQAHLDDFLAGRQVLLDQMGPETAPLIEQAAAAVAGGKRLRPAFCLAGWRAAGGDAADEHVVGAAASLELLQASALMHDDLMDDSDMRRGRPSAHRTFERLHRDAGWHGDPVRFGAGAAVLLGDLLLAWAYEMLRDCGLGPEPVTRAAPWFDACTTEVSTGQYLDLVAQATATASEEMALRVVRFKAASYTVVRPLHLGAALAGAGEELHAGLAAYGTPVGIAFQLRDDVLGVFGDPDHTGKPAGDDLREGKRTVLLARTAERSDDHGRALIARLVGDRDLGTEGLRLLRGLITSTGALASVEHTIRALHAEALTALETLALVARGDGAEDVRTDLACLATAAVQRTR